LWGEYAKKQVREILFFFSFLRLRLPLADAEEETGAAEEPQTSDEADEGKGGGCPQEGLEEMRCAAGGVGLRIVSVGFRKII
jgi:hypothetical protein